MSQAKYSSQTGEAIEEISKLISQITGNQFSDKHRSMIEFRLQKRCLDLKINGIDNYISYFKANQSTEVNYLISLLTTHHTFFFREFLHFQYLEDYALPELIPLVRQRADKKIRVWSAACSKGHEVYSLAMFFDYTLREMAPDLSYHILGSDIDSESLSHAYNGVYTRKDIKEVPMNYLDNHWDRGAGEVADFVKARSTLRSHVNFKQMNLLNIPANFNDKFDIIFCRNVFIYFDQEQIKKSSLELLKHLEPHGHYIVGLSESIVNLGLPIVSRGPSIFRKLSVVESKPQTQSNTTPVAPSPKPTTSATANPTTQLNTTRSTNTMTSSAAKSNGNAAAKVSSDSSSILASNPSAQGTGPLKVLCVDDSPSILNLLESIIKSAGGFEVIGKAMNGIEAAEKVKELKPDLITMDIHMPNQNGVEYLQKNFRTGHPPVIIISSVSREDSDLALKALNYGASDYVEKPALSNINEVSEEIIRKLKCAHRNKIRSSNKSHLKLDESFKRISQIKNPSQFIRVIVGALSDKDKIQTIIKEVGANQPPTFILLDGAKDTLQGFAQGFNFKNKTIGSWPSQVLNPDDIFVADAKQFSSYFSSKVKEIPASVLVMGSISPNLKSVLEKWKKAQILLEDLGLEGNLQSPFKPLASDIVPTTSFAYMSTEFLSKI